MKFDELALRKGAKGYIDTVKCTFYLLFIYFLLISLYVSWIGLDPV